MSISKGLSRLGLGLGLSLSMVTAALAEVVPITLLHLNDLYEITAVEGGKRGGLARVATLRKQLLAQNSHTITVLAGDLLSPSALGTAIVEGQRLAGQQMVAVMNAIGLDYATFGNHEFDLSETELLKRLGESKFQWLSSNVSDAQGQAFPNVLKNQIITLKAPSGQAIRVGVMGVTISSNPVKYAQYSDPIQTAKQQAQQLRGQVDILIALTHLSLEQDQQLAATVPEVDLILGGHEHENIQQWRLITRLSRPQNCSDNGLPIFKADANARSVYIHTLSYDTQTRCLTVNSKLQAITAALPEDPKTARVVKNWQDRGFQGFRTGGFKPEAVITTLVEALDGTEVNVRNQPTNLTQLIAQAMLRVAATQSPGVPEPVNLAIFNSGSIRIDDQLPPGPITQYDVIRILPFGGKVLVVKLPGALLQKVLTQGQANRGTGGFLQTANVTQSANGQWLIQEKPLQIDRDYVVAINDFLISGREIGLDYLTLKAPGVTLLADKGDIRFALIKEMQRSGK